MKLKRYHIEIFCPDWARDSILSFCDTVSKLEIKPSLHAKKKLRGMKKKYRIVVKQIIKELRIADPQNIDYIFEFYTDLNKVVKKVCYRFPMKELDSDLILVISSTGKIVTIYLNNNFDFHHNLKHELYEKG